MQRTSAIGGQSKLVLEQVDRSYLARRDRWVQVRLGLLRSEGGAAAAAQIDRIVGHRLEEAMRECGRMKAEG